MVTALLAGIADGGAGDRVTVAVDARICQGLIDHQPAADVVYQPGVDRRGKPVAPADLTPPFKLKALDGFSEQLTIDLAPSYGPADPLDPELRISVATVDWRDGKLFIDGQPVDAAGEAQLAEACNEWRARRKR